MKEDVEGSGWEPQRVKMQFTWIAKQMSGKHIFAGLCRDNGSHRDSESQSRLWSLSPVEFLHPHRAQIFADISGDSSILGNPLHLNSFRQLGGISRFLPNSFESWFFSAQNNPHAKETFQGGKFCSPTKWCLGCTPACSVTQLCLTLCDPMDHSPPGSSFHGTFQARIPE